MSAKHDNVVMELWLHTKWIYGERGQKLLHISLVRIANVIVSWYLLRTSSAYDNLRCAHYESLDRPTIGPVTSWQLKDSLFNINEASVSHHVLQPKRNSYIFQSVETLKVSYAPLSEGMTCLAVSCGISISSGFMAIPS